MGGPGSGGPKGSRVSSERAAARREAMFEDYLELVSAGTGLEEACRRVGTTPANMMRTAYRWGRKDIATPLCSLTWRDRERRRSA
jgi:hypothetical protein